jgi:hypothetical protein
VLIYNRIKGVVDDRDSGEEDEGRVVAASPWGQCFDFFKLNYIILNYLYLREAE